MSFLRCFCISCSLSADWRRLYERIDDVTTQIKALSKQDENCKRLM